MQWLQTKEEWDREKVFLAEMGYLPDDADPEVKPPSCLSAAQLQACVLQSLFMALVSLLSPARGTLSLPFDYYMALSASPGRHAHLPWQHCGEQDC